MAIHESEGRDVTVRFDSRLCIHARRCVTGAPAAFNPDAGRNWMNADAASAEELVRIAYACPSGAITVERRDGGEGETPPQVNTVTVRQDGPLVVHADLEIAGHGRVTRATLCRCGLSRNKPLCDNSHIAGGFEATGEPESGDVALALAEMRGPVRAEPIPNGPLRLSGPVEVEAASGRPVQRVKSAFFCRCGQSRNKPFCDGSHKEAGFVAE